MVLIIFLATLFLGLAAGVPVAFALIFCALVLMSYMGLFNPQIISQQMVTGSNSFTLLAIPFFLLAGELMNAGGLSKRIVSFAIACVGHIRGGLGIVAVIAAVVMASLSGSAAADSAALAAILIPMMREAGYNVPRAAGLMAAGGVIAPVIPPSIAFIIFGVAANVSITALFMGGIVPGILMAASLIIRIMTHLFDKAQLHDCRDAFTQTLEQLGAANPDIVAVCNDSVGSSKLAAFRDRFPERLINVGIAEQNMVGVGAGLANGGKIPFVCAAAPFLTGRALEQIKADVAYSETNVKLVGISSGMAYGELGPTHHSIEDFAWIRALPNVPVIAPADRNETAAVIRWAAAYQGGCFLRLSRVGVPDLLPEDHVFELGKANLLRDGTDLTIIAAALLAEHGISARILNMACVRPIDQVAIQSAANETGAILTCEEHTIFGGLGSAVAEVVVDNCPVPMTRLGVPGVFAHTASANRLLDDFGMSPKAIAKSAKDLLARKG